MLRPEYIYECGPLRLDTRARQLLRENTPVALAPKSFELLRVLLENYGRAMSKSELMDALWPDLEVEEGNLPFQALTLRKALGPEAGTWIETVPRHGYRWSAPVVRHLAADPEITLAPISNGRPLPLPAPLTSFIGRDKELAAVKQLLLSSDVRLLTLTGAGGVGKTRLALQVATDLAHHFPAGVHFVPLAAITHPEMVAVSIAESMQFRHTGGKPLIEAVREHLRQAVRAPALLLIDNFEHLLPAAPLLIDLLESCALSKVLVTSRAVLHLYGEHEYLVSGLAVPDAESLPSFQELSRNAAITLFVQRAAAVSPGFELTVDNAGAAAGICSRLDGLPLAIELAAVRIRMLSPSEILARLEKPLDLLTGVARDVPARRQTLRKTIEWSYSLLNPAEQKLFRRLAVFVGGCTLEGAEAVCDTRRDLELNLADGMSSLVDNSLLQQSERQAGEPRFLMLEIIREYALERLVESGEWEPVRRAHAAYCLVLAEENLSMVVAQQSEWLSRCTTEHSNLRAAIDGMIESGNAEWAMRMGVALFAFWERQVHLTEGLHHLKEILQMSRAADVTAQRAMVASCAGAIAAGLGHWDDCWRLLGESLEIYQELGDKQGIARQLNLLGANRGLAGDYSEARPLLEQSLLMWRDLGDPSAVAGVLCNLADLVNLQEDHSQASSLLEEALAIFRKLGDESGAAWVLSYLGDVARARGDAESARSLHSESANVFRDIGERAGLARSHADLGYVACDAGNYLAAASMFEQALRIYLELGNKRGVARVLDGFAYLAVRQSSFDGALMLAGAADSLRRSVGARLRPFEQVSLEKIIGQARERQNPESAEAAWGAGCRMSLKEAVDYVRKLPSRDR